MKLLYCPHCQDIVRLKKMPKICDCGKVGGRYLEDGIVFEYYGQDAIPLFIANSSIVTAINRRSDSAPGSRFTACVIPRDCDTIRHHE